MLQVPQNIVYNCHFLKLWWPLDHCYISEHIHQCISEHMYYYTLKNISVQSISFVTQCILFYGFQKEALPDYQRLRKKSQESLLKENDPLGLY